MALIKCPECGTEVSDKAPTCIHCGYPIKEYVDNTPIPTIPHEDGETKIICCCPRCGNVYHVHIGTSINDTCLCTYCKIPMIMYDTNLSEIEFSKLFHNGEFYRIEERLIKKYTIGSPQFNQKAFDKNEQINREIRNAPKLSSNRPKCVSCGSTDLRKISTASKAGSVLMWGIFATGKVSKTWHCNNCGTEF